MSDGMAKINMNWGKGGGDLLQRERSVEAGDAKDEAGFVSGFAPPS